MKKITLYLTALISFTVSFAIKADCFLVKENDKVIKQDGDCKSRYAPCSTFKIVLSLMGYDDGFLIDETHPKLPFKKGYDDYLEVWKQPHTPKDWMKNSCLWYSRLITKELGYEKFHNYVTKFNYGNQDTSRDKGKNNGLTNAWLSSSLEISPEEQIAFLQKLAADQLPVSLKAQEMTKNIMFIEDFADGWKLYAKTGSGNRLNEDRTIKLKDCQIGWFIGWLQKDNRKVFFVHFIEDKEHHDSYASFRSREAAKEKLKGLISKELK
ncbi:class D beta-lactamase [Rickettsia bellii]|uniref:Beta-lactamase n=1 Tax=Rickettsia bellii str. RML Mogi TaxID=1359194 RepID=A0A0F3QK16_RICBE|nr:class D beta-lactamase [Rickettsia bellii]KJV92501.1 beta-lactamase OXA-1 [Rickettsia bellii str. RML Mogi]